MDRDQTIIQYIPYAAGIARSMKRGDPDESVSVAFEALINAVDEYDAARGATVKTHIGNEVRQSVIDWHRKSTGWNHSLKKPTQNHSLLLTDNLDDYENDLAVSVNGTEQQIINKDLASKILGYISRKKPPRTLQIFHQRYYNDLTLKKIGANHKVTCERISQILTKATTQAKEHFRQEA